MSWGWGGGKLDAYCELSRRFVCLHHEKSLQMAQVQEYKKLFITVECLIEAWELKLFGIKFHSVDVGHIIHSTRCRSSSTCGFPSSATFHGRKTTHWVNFICNFIASCGAYKVGHSFTRIVSSFFALRCWIHASWLLLKSWIFTVWSAGARSLNGWEMLHYAIYLWHNTLTSGFGHSEMI